MKTRVKNIKNQTGLIILFTQLIEKKIRSKYYKEPELKESHRFEPTYAMDTPRKNVRGGS